MRNKVGEIRVWKIGDREHDGQGQRLAERFKREVRHWIRAEDAEEGNQDAGVVQREDKDATSFTARHKRRSLWLARVNAEGRKQLGEEARRRYGRKAQMLETEWHTAKVIGSEECRGRKREREPAPGRLEEKKAKGRRTEWPAPKNKIQASRQT